MSDHRGAPRLRRGAPSVGGKGGPSRPPFPTVVLALALIIVLLPLTARANGWDHGAIPFEALLRALRFEQPETRRRAAESLGFRGQREAVDALLACLAEPEPDPHVRSAIYVALGRLRDPRGVTPLSRCLESESREEVRSDCVLALGLLGDASTLPRLVGLLHDDPSFLVRSRAVDALGSFADPAAVAALATLTPTERNAHLRLRAIRALGRTRSPHAVEPLLSALAAARDDTERGVVVTALGEIRSREATRPLTALLDSSTNPELRARVVIALGAIRDGGAYQSLVKLLADATPAVRFFAVEALRAMGRGDAAADPPRNVGHALQSRKKRS